MQKELCDRHNLILEDGVLMSCIDITQLAHRTVRQLCLWFVPCGNLY